MCPADDPCGGAASTRSPTRSPILQAGLQTGHRTGCDEALWQLIPPGAIRDLRRYAESGETALATARIATMREVASYLSDDAGPEFAREPWDAAVASWEANEAVKEAEAIKAAKAAKLAAAKARKAKADAAAAAAA